MFQSKPFSKNRLVIFDLLNRINKDHAPITGAFEWDITDTLERIERDRAKGRDVGLASFVLKACSHTIEQFPRLNKRLFRYWYGPREVTWNEISCNLVVSRKNKSGEEILLPTVIRNCNEKSVEEIHCIIRDLKAKSLSDLPQFALQKKIRSLPRIVLKLFDRMVRKSPSFYIQRFGTFGLSALIHENSGGVGGSVLSPSTTFYPTNIQEKPIVRDGAICIRKMILFGLCVDHHIVDGIYALNAAQHLKEYIENPESILGPEDE